MHIHTPVIVQSLLQFPWNNNHRRHQHQHPTPRLPPSVHCALTKHGQRFIQKLTLAAADTSAADRLMKKFVASSPKAIVLNALSHLLSPDTKPHYLSTHALPFYSTITEASWFQWNPKLLADLISFLDKHGSFDESDRLTEETALKLKPKERDLALFYCNLIEFHSNRKSDRGFNLCLAQLQHFIRNSTSVHVKRQCYKAVIGGLCEIGRAGEAEEVVEEMRVVGIRPSAYEWRRLVYGYGRLGLFEEMVRAVDGMERDGFLVDTVCSNMVLSSFGANKELGQMRQWLQKVKGQGIAMSVRTYNTVLNSCPVIMELTQNNLCNLPLSIEQLKRAVSAEEMLIVEELVGDSTVLQEAMEWSQLEVKVDLHGMHVGSAYLITLQWVEEMKRRFGDDTCAVPAEVTVVCGVGKHSSVRGESPVKKMVREMMVRMESPMRIDRKNTGCFVAKGRVLKEWLCN